MPGHIACTGTYSLLLYSVTHRVKSWNNFYFARTGDFLKCNCSVIFLLRVVKYLRCAVHDNKSQLIQQRNISREILKRESRDFLWWTAELLIFCDLKASKKVVNKNWEGRDEHFVQISSCGSTCSTCSSISVLPEHLQSVIGIICCVIVDKQ